MGKGGDSNANSDLRLFSWDEVKKHVEYDDRWIVVDGGVYDVTRWQKRHPGGAKIIGHYAGQDATVSGEGAGGGAGKAGLGACISM